MKKEIFVLISLIGLVAIFSLIPILSARAGTLTSVTVSPSDTVGGRTANYTIGFTTATTILAASTTKIALTFPSGFDVASAATSTEFISGTDSRTVNSLTVAAQVITLNLSATTTAITAPAAVSLTLTTIVSPLTGGDFTVAVATQDQDAATIDSETSAAFTIISGAGATSAKITKKTYNINFSASPPEAGIIPSSDSFTEGTVITAIAIPKTGYIFISWEENGVEISKSSTYSFTVDANRELVARFKAVEVAAPEVPVVEKPVTEMTVEELKTKIAEIQQKIIDLLEQIIQIVQQQIQELLAK